MRINNSIQLITIFGLFFILSSTATAVEPKTDFNGDGKADLFVRNVFTGTLNGWLVNGTNVSSKLSFGKVLPKTGNITLGVKDANGDGISDLYWYNGKTGNVSSWLMNGATILQKTSYGGLSPKLGWSPYGLADFNNDGKFDMLWYNSYTGDIQSWNINGTTVINKRLWGTLSPSTGWFPIGVKDLNGNGYADLLIYNIYTGYVDAWLDNGTMPRYGKLLINNGWMPIGLEDFNGDLKSDLLVYNKHTGDLDVWYINGSTLYDVVSLGKNDINSGLAIAGFSDFNGDGRTDILWYNGFTGETKAWLTGVSIVNYGSKLPTEGWRPMGLDDFNGDGKADLLWFNAFTNETATWLLNGTGIQQTASYGPIPASSVWTINIPR